MSMFNDIDWTKMMEFVFRIQRMSNITRRNSCKDTGRFWVMERKRSGMELFPARLKESGILQPNWRWKDSKTQVIQYSRVSVLLSLGILKKKNGRDTIRFNADALNTELLFQITHSVNQLSICGPVTIWSEQFGLTEEEKGQEKLK